MGPGPFVKLAWVAAFGLLAACAGAQIPDVRIHFDGIVSYRIVEDGPTALRYYSLFGRPSTASLSFTLEPGFKAFISQRLQRIPGDGDPDQIDQAFVEDEGIWRVGKQVLPFGTGNLLRESCLAARGDTNLVVEGLPLAIAFVDAGEQRQRGIVGRIGTSAYGLSFAVGHHFGISGTSLTQIRRPEDTGGVGRGWDRAFGFDLTRRVAHMTLAAEGLLLNGGATAKDDDRTVLDFTATASQAPFSSLTIGYTVASNPGQRFFRFVGSVPMTSNVTAMPFVRFRDSRLWDIGAELRIRL